jgi:hypothetical protein
MVLNYTTCGPEPMQILENSATRSSQVAAVRITAGCEIDQKLTRASNGSDDSLVGLLSVQLCTLARLGLGRCTQCVP